MQLMLLCKKGAGFLRLPQACILKHIPLLVILLYLDCENIAIFFAKKMIYFAKKRKNLQKTRNYRRNITLFSKKD